MIRLKNLFIVKSIIIFLIIFIFQGDITIYGNDVKENHFDLGITKYIEADYDAAISYLKSALEVTTTNDNEFLSKIYLLLGACYEKQDEDDNAKAFFSLIKQMLDENIIKKAPEIKGLDLKFPKIYKDLMRKRKMKGRVILRPGWKPLGKSVKKAKFPWTLVICVTAFAAIIFLLATRKRTKGDEITDPYRDIEWIRIPSGEFMMGDNFNEGEADEQPVHLVYLDEYYISKYEVTFAQWDKFCEETGRAKPYDGIVDGNIFSQSWGRGLMPVINITWDDANAYCKWLSQKTGENVKLPTEAQWEKAARGTDQRRYPWGNDEPTILTSHCMFSYSSNRLKPAQVGSFPKGQSPYGVFNMAGNVSEWCRDWYSSNYYKISPYKNPLGPETSLSHVIRGGNFTSNSMDVRSSDRKRESTNNFVYYYCYVGFRVVKEN